MEFKRDKYIAEELVSYLNAEDIVYKWWIEEGIHDFLYDYATKLWLDSYELNENLGGVGKKKIEFRWFYIVKVIINDDTTTWKLFKGGHSHNVLSRLKKLQRNFEKRYPTKSISLCTPVQYPLGFLTFEEAEKREGEIFVALEDAGFIPSPWICQGFKDHVREKGRTNYLESINDDLEKSKGMLKWTDNKTSHNHMVGEDSFFFVASDGMSELFKLEDDIDTDGVIDFLTECFSETEKKITNILETKTMLKLITTR